VLEILAIEWIGNFLICIQISICTNFLHEYHGDEHLSVPTTLLFLCQLLDQFLTRGRFGMSSYSVTIFSVPFIAILIWVMFHKQFYGPKSTARWYLMLLAVKCTNVEWKFIVYEWGSTVDEVNFKILWKSKTPNSDCARNLCGQEHIGRLIFFYRFLMIFRFWSEFLRLQISHSQVRLKW
jgi:hypothetical protein